MAFAAPAAAQALATPAPPVVRADGTTVADRHHDDLSGHTHADPSLHLTGNADPHPRADVTGRTHAHPHSHVTGNADPHPHTDAHNDVTGCTHADPHAPSHHHGTGHADAHPGTHHDVARTDSVADDLVPAGFGWVGQLRVRLPDRHLERRRIRRRILRAGTRRRQRHRGQLLGAAQRQEGHHRGRRLPVRPVPHLLRGAGHADLRVPRDAAGQLAGLDYEFAYDIWLTTSSAATSFDWNNDLELMIWTDVNGQRPAGSKVDTLTDGAAVWFAGTIGDNNSTVSVVLPSNSTAGTVDIASIVAQLKSLGYVPSSDNGILDVEYGIEAPYGGGNTFAVTGLSVSS